MMLGQLIKSDDGYDLPITKTGNAADSVAALRAIDLTSGWAAVPPRA